MCVVKSGGGAILLLFISQYFVIPRPTRRYTPPQWSSRRRMPWRFGWVGSTRTPRADFMGNPRRPCERFCRMYSYSHGSLRNVLSLRPVRFGSVRFSRQGRSRPIRRRLDADGHSLNTPDVHLGVRFMFGNRRCLSDQSGTWKRREGLVFGVVVEKKGSREER